MSDMAGAISDARATATRKEGSLLVIGLVGFSSSLTWVFLLLTTAAPTAVHSWYESWFVRVIMIAGAAIALFVCWLLAEFISRRSWFLPVVGLLALSSCLVLLFPSLADIAHVVFLVWGLAGAGGACVFLLWGGFFSAHGRSRGLPYLAGSVLLAMLLALGISFLGRSTSFALATILELLSMVILVSLQNLWRSSSREEIESISEADDRSGPSWQSALMTGVFGVGLSFSLYYLVEQALLTPRVMFALGGAVGLSCVVILFDARKTHVITRTLLLKLLAPCVAVGLFPMPFLGVTGRVLCNAFLLFVFMTHVIVNLGVASKEVGLTGLSPVRVFSISGVAGAFGMMAGWLLGYGTFRVADGALVIAVPIGLMCMFILIAALIVEDPYTDGVALSSPRGDSSEEQDAGPSSSRGKSLWKQRCSMVADRYGLSSRESEVLFLLAKGRNAEYIENKLFISNHTAKAHIYNIYRKTGVHSRHELMDLIERFNIPRERT
ncbi:MAG: helix-turn-helix transcriptional regulator [Coriobacteriia bacterium]|nr:helix-turn-helix transcriptional regulator [Coriobacteriia bacterium]